MSPHNRVAVAGRTISIALCAGAAAMALATVSCIKQKDSLVIVGMTAETTIPGPIQVHITVGSVSQTFDLAAGLSATTPTQRGVYLDSNTTGSQVVNATTQAGIRQRRGRSALSGAWRRSPRSPPPRLCEQNP